MSRPLTKPQLATLGCLATAAWDVTPQTRRDAIRAEATAETHDPLISDAQVRRWWRANEQRKATGHESMTTMGQGQYLTMKAHWELYRDTAGGTKSDCALRTQTVKTMADQATEEIRRARWLIQRECEEAGVAYPKYPDAIAKDQFRVRLEEATLKQTWCLLYTCRNRLKDRPRTPRQDPKTAPPDEPVDEHPW